MANRRLNESDMYKFLKEKEALVGEKGLSGHLLTMEPHVAETLELIKVNFPNYTSHGIQHSLRIIDYVYKILGSRIKNSLSDMEIFCFIMSALFHDTGMALSDVEDKEKQRRDHHLYSKNTIEEYCNKELSAFPEYKRVSECVVFVCAAHGYDINDLYKDEKMNRIDTIDGSNVRYGLIAILLRMGDLMDLEQKRVSEYNLRINKNYYNIGNSIEHNERHLKVKCYKYSSDNIYVDVEVSTRVEYVIWQKWLSYLDEEVMYANTHYFTEANNDRDKNYRLPEVKYQIIPTKEANISVEEIRFEIDDKGALWDILTKSIYTNELDFIRELIQNAIDANLLKKYLSNVTEKNEDMSPRAWNVSEEVSVFYSEKENILVVDDNGIGMNEEEVRNYLFKAADSGYKYKKKRENFDFPAIAKFGIGFVSCLTKARHIEILTNNDKDESIYTYIEDKSNTALLERISKRKKSGTTIFIKVKNAYSFKEILEYLNYTFKYTSVTIKIFNLDNLVKNNIKIGCTNIKLENVNVSTFSDIQEKIDLLRRQRNNIVKEYGRELSLCNEVIILCNDENKNDNVIKELDLVLRGATYDSDIKANLQKIIRSNQGDKERSIIKLLKDYKNIIENALKEYPAFEYEISNSDFINICNYKVMVLNLDSKFDITEVRTDEEIVTKKMGVMFIRTTIDRPDIGIEWQTVNCFIYNNNKIVQNLIQNSSIFEKEDADESMVISLSEIEDMEYEMNIQNEDDSNEEYYKRLHHNYYGFAEYEKYEEEEYLYNLVLPIENDLYVFYDANSSDINMPEENGKSLLDVTRSPIGYEGDDYAIKESYIYQDGIRLQINPHSIVPLGIGWSEANLTANARLDLNVSRHEINMNREVIDAWVRNYGIIIQEQVLENCLNVFKKLNLEYNVDELFYNDAEKNDFSKRCYDSMKELLKIRCNKK